MLRNCKSKEAEVKRINKELANIRSKFKVSVPFHRFIFFGKEYLALDVVKISILLTQGDKTLDGYQKKKYVCKLLFIFLLGHDIDFGQMEAVNLLSSNKYTEKQIVSIADNFQVFALHKLILFRATSSFRS